MTTGRATCTAQVRGHLCLASLEGDDLGRFDGLICEIYGLWYPLVICYIAMV